MKSELFHSPFLRMPPKVCRVSVWWRPGRRHVATRAQAPLQRPLCIQGEWSLQQWLAVFRTIQSWEVAQNHGQWIEANNPEFGPGIRERFNAASQVTSEAVEEAKAEQRRCRFFAAVKLHWCYYDVARVATRLLPLQLLFMGVYV